jgi:hypothetical protein
MTDSILAVMCYLSERIQDSDYVNNSDEIMRSGPCRQASILIQMPTHPTNESELSFK